MGLLSAVHDGEAERRAKIEAAVAVVRTRFLAELDVRLAELQDLAAAAGRGDEVARDALRRGLHSIAGAAPTLGLGDLGDSARTLEAMVARGEALASEDLGRALRPPVL